MERKEVMLNPPQGSQPLQESEEEHSHGGMVHIALSLSLCLSSFSINKKKLLTEIIKQCDCSVISTTWFIAHKDMMVRCMGNTLF